MCIVYITCDMNTCAKKTPDVLETLKMVFVVQICYTNSKAYPDYQNRGIIL